MKRKLSFVLVASLVVIASPVSLLAWDEGYISLITPVKTEAPLTIEPDISFRLGQVIPPDEANFRISDGIVLFDAAKIGFSYITDNSQQELAIDVSGWLPIGPFKAGADAEIIWARIPGALTEDERYWSAAATLFASGWIVPDIFNAALNLQYDIYYSRFNTGLGLSFAVIPDTLSIVAEAAVSPVGNVSWMWDAGVLIKTAGHQFLLYVGNGTDMKMRNTLAGENDPGDLTFGFTLRRKIDIYFGQN